MMTFHIITGPKRSVKKQTLYNLIPSRVSKERILEIDFTGQHDVDLKSISKISQSKKEVKERQEKIYIVLLNRNMN